MLGKRTQVSLTERLIAAKEITDKPVEAGGWSYEVGDINSEEKGSGARANGGKTEYHLVPLSLLRGTADVFSYGKRKYSEWNWAKGMAWSIPFDCAQRHLSAFFFEKEELDAESTLHHIDHAICNLIMLKHYITYYEEGDDRPENFKNN